MPASQNTLLVFFPNRVLRCRLKFSANLGAAQCFGLDPDPATNEYFSVFAGREAFQTMTGGFSHITLSPFAALKKAVAKVPQLKWALGLMGVAAVPAIVLAWFADHKVGALRNSHHDRLDVCGGNRR
jgi:hypothetical protein